MINLAVLKLFVDDRNSFSIEKREKLSLYQTTSHALIEEKIEEGRVVLQNNEKVKTNLLYMTSSDTPRTDIVQGTSITRINTLVSQDIDLPLTDLMANQRDQTLTGI